MKLKTNLKNDTVKIGQSYSGFHCIHNKPENQVAVEWYPHMAKEIKPINDLPDEVLEVSKVMISTYSDRSGQEEMVGI